MKTYLHLLLDVLFVAIVFYGMATFFYLTPNPTKWSHFARVVVGGIPGFCAIVAWLFSDRDNKTNRADDL